jgi:hypothetical protein
MRETLREIDKKEVIEQANEQIASPSNCEYKQDCAYAHIKCDFSNKSDCGDWHTWKGIDLNILFKE